MEGTRQSAETCLARTAAAHARPLRPARGARVPLTEARQQHQRLYPAGAGRGALVAADDVARGRADGARERNHRQHPRLAGLAVQRMQRLERDLQHLQPVDARLEVRDLDLIAGRRLHIRCQERTAVAVRTRRPRLATRARYRQEEIDVRPRSHVLCLLATPQTAKLVLTMPAPEVQGFSAGSPWNVALKPTKNARPTTNLSPCESMKPGPRVSGRLTGETARRCARNSSRSLPCARSALLYKDSEWTPLLCSKCNIATKSQRRGREAAPLRWLRPPLHKSLTPDQHCSGQNVALRSCDVSPRNVVSEMLAGKHSAAYSPRPFQSPTAPVFNWAREQLRRYTKAVARRRVSPSPNHTTALSIKLPYSVQLEHLPPPTPRVCRNAVSDHPRSRSTSVAQWTPAVQERCAARLSAQVLSLLSQFRGRHAAA